MTPRHRLIAVLLRLYPAAWRREYGAELADMLKERPLRLRVVADVLRAGAWQRLRAAEPSTILGVISAAGVIAGLAWPPFEHGPALSALIRRSGKTLPAYEIRSNEIYVVLLVVCGCWTALRGRVSHSQCGLAAVRMSLIGGAPILALGVLMMVGLIAPPSDGDAAIPSVFVFTAPLFALPAAWLWGAVGGQLRRWIGWARRATA